ncbi:MAG TPA: aldehyde dehydrogenase family protein [Puia sp.]|uniref:aldehyde dehydrogenase family protein n=1 Tax=Puia sp. TaxID=2045100 RepID=UPI002CFD1C20|nr:aldehyde dehydrogenase family protein [Puia sp.]HVU98823.1 aldehyde dehydrogenase family protein [Puia sp.]
MNGPAVSIDPEPLRRFFQSGATRSFGWRQQQLLLLQQAIREEEAAIHAALYADLKKSPEEAYATETGLTLAEIRHALKHLAKWMRPQKAGTNLVNIPAASRVYRDPLGVVLIIAPWNYPFQLSLIPLAAALAAGNTVVLKPSEWAPATAAIVERLLTRIFPPEVVTVVLGDGAEIVPALIRKFRFDHIFFTGSNPVGRAIYRLAAEQLIPVTLELGGKSPVIVEKDANLRVAARRIVIGKFLNAGQTCIAPDYLLVHAAVKDRLLQHLRETIREFYGPEPADSYDYGKIISEKRFDTLVNFLKDGKVAEGGGADREKRYLAPTLLTDVDPNAAIMQEEIFGPLLPVFTYSTTEEALAFVRKYPDPLAFYLFTADTSLQRTWIEGLRFGGGCINNTDWHFANLHLPFGGIGQSGIGAYHGKYSFERFTHAKAVMKTPTMIDPSIKYPPFKGKMKWFKRFIR